MSFAKQQEKERKEEEEKEQPQQRPAMNGWMDGQESLLVRMNEGPKEGGKTKAKERRNTPKSGMKETNPRIH